MSFFSESFFADGLKERESFEVGIHPFVEIPDISNCVNDSARPQHVSILREQRSSYYPSFMLASLEVRIRKKEKECGEGVFGEVIW